MYVGRRSDPKTEITKMLTVIETKTTAEMTDAELETLLSNHEEFKAACEALAMDDAAQWEFRSELRDEMERRGL